MKNSFGHAIVKIHSHTYSDTYTLCLLDRENNIVDLVQNVYNGCVEICFFKCGCYKLIAIQDSFPYNIIRKNIFLCLNRKICISYNFSKSPTRQLTDFKAFVSDANYKNIYFKGVAINIGYFTDTDY